MTTPTKNPAAVALGRLGRSKNSPAQREAARKNGKQGGRPKKSERSKAKEAAWLDGQSGRDVY